MLEYIENIRNAGPDSNKTIIKSTMIYLHKNVKTAAGCWQRQLCRVNIYTRINHYQPHNELTNHEYIQVNTRYILLPSCHRNRQ